MATSTGPDLTNATAIVESLMDDTCVIVSPMSPTQGGDLDPDTLRYPAPSAVPAAYVGRCKFKTGAASLSRPGGAVQDDSDAQVDIPISAPEIGAGSYIVITSSRRDSSAVGLVLEARGTVFKTIAVKRGINAKRLVQLSTSGGIGSPIDFTDEGINERADWHSGHGAPPLSYVWDVGDYWLDLDTGNVYQNRADV